MRSHRDIVDAIGPNRVSDTFGIPLSTTRSWSRRDSIPAEFWFGFVTRRWATYSDLAVYAANANPATLPRRDRGDAR